MSQIELARKVLGSSRGCRRGNGGGTTDAFAESFVRSDTGYRPCLGRVRMRRLWTEPARAFPTQHLGSGALPSVASAEETVSDSVTERVRAWLRRQREDLIDLSRRNRLLYFRHTKTASLEIVHPGPSEILTRLGRTPAGGVWDFYLPREPDDLQDRPAPQPRANELVIGNKDAAQIEQGLRLLERKANQDYVDKGLWVLYLGIGMLRWIEAEDEPPSLSPLLLLPVTVARNSLREPFRLRRTEDDPVINPALAVKLHTDFDLSLPAIDEIEDSGLELITSRVGELIGGRNGWSVTPRVVLSTFSFQKEAMYRDLKDNEDVVVAHPMVQLLALGPEAPSAGDFDFDPVPEERLDQDSPPEDLVSVQDADASQRRCIIAARGGHSFVMDGPPGTGKSQTITNMIAELMHAGKSVLFVSEKAAALDVVHDRLKERRLDEFVLRLHSHEANRKTVTAELGRALTSRPVARDTFTPSHRADLAQRRKALSSYAQAMNEIRQPLARSLHDVLGRISALQAVPQAPVPSGFGMSLDADRLTTLRDIADALGRAWGPVTRGRDFLWRDLKDGTLSAARRNELERVIDDAKRALASLNSVVLLIDNDLGLAWDGTVNNARRLLQLLTLLQDRRQIPTAWLSVDSLDPIAERAASLEEATGKHRAVADELAALVGPEARPLDVDRTNELDASIVALRASDVAWAPDEDAPIDQLRTVNAFLSNSPARLTVIAQDARRLAAAFGLQEPWVTLNRAFELAELGSLAGAAVRPEPHWLNPADQGALDEAARVLGELLTDYRARQNQLRTIFTDDVLGLDLQALHVRFTEVHHGFGKLRSAYREDKRALARCTVAGRVNRKVRDRLADAVAWKELADRLTAAESRHAGVLGEHYYQRADADFGRISSAIEVAHRALTLAGQHTTSEGLTRQLARGGSPDPTLVPVAARLQEEVSAWSADAKAMLASAADSLAQMSLPEAANWCDGAAVSMHVILGAIEHVSAVAGRPVTLAVAQHALRLAAEQRELREIVEGTFDQDSAELGPSFHGLMTDWDAVGQALRWSQDLRAVLDGPLHRLVAAAVLATTFTPDDVRVRIGEWDKTTRRLTSAFAEPQHTEISARLAGEFGDALRILDNLTDTIGDIEEWSAYDTAKDRLEQAGLEPVVSFCIQHQVPADHVAMVVERALLEAWADDLLAREKSRIGWLRADDRDALVERFHALDQEQVAAAAARVINASAARRPTSIVGATAIIQRQAQLQRRHMPIRKLMEQTGMAVQQLKPCFMMNPLSVSQFLPPTMRFDVVIFDEASQVRPCDAVNCVYRGGQLIVAGDENQLPPTTFFAAIGSVDDDAYDEDQIDDFESVLKLCKAAGALRSLPLNWHYRSEHELLITFSNYRFYEGRLLTFPGATHEAPDVGIELFKVDGMYRRGGARDNPIEASKVIDRVLYHRRHHPDRTLGVVAFSTAQEDAIERELERQAQQFPELAELQTDDRLHGFFIKNLENVQGDERDTILFSIGYGPDEHGKFTLNMGPLNKPSGWRRLNVAITRAKRRVEVVTSVLPDDFVGDVTAGGVRHLRSYLDFARRGIAALALDPIESHGGEESPFEEEVAKVIRAWGYEAVTQVGVAGYRIDIAVRDPLRPGSFILAVECDGAMYHSSKVARDRDRLRQQVLEGLGWRVHRIWGTAWYRDRQAQEGRLRAAIEAAGQQGSYRRRDTAPPAVQPDVFLEEVDFDAAPSWTVPYRTTPLGPARSPHEMHMPEARSDLRRLIETVVRFEGPVHEERVLQSVRRAWGNDRAGSRMREAFSRAVRDLTRSGIERDHAGFLKTKFSKADEVRVPTDDPETRREVRHVPSEELGLAVVRFVAEAHAVSRDELSMRIARLFGWQRRGPDIQAALEDVVGALLAEGRLRATGELVEVML
jgi:very-short-patch-repair endonuclease/ribosomal protein S7